MIDHIIFGFHGIYTGSENWNDKYRRWLMENHYTNVAFEELDFGTIMGWQMYLDGVVPWIGNIRTARVGRRIEDILGEYPFRIPYSFVSHSYGTWLSTNVLLRFPDIKPEASVLFGSVLREDFNRVGLAKAIDRRQTQRVLNFWSDRDNVIENMSQPFFGVTPFGHAGSRGFVKGIGKRDVRQVKTHEDHGTYFSGQHTDQYFEQATTFCLE